MLTKKFLKLLSVITSLLFIFVLAISPNALADNQQIATDSKTSEKEQKYITGATANITNDCPKNLNCQILPGQSSHSKTNRDNSTTGPQFRFIVIHDTEEQLTETLGLVQSPDYTASWNFTMDENKVYQHFDAKTDLLWHAGNFYFNMHALGIEHIGYIGGGGWYTDKLYRDSAVLVKSLAQKYNIPLDKAHIIGHENIPGISVGATQNVHKDPGPFWNWDLFFKYLDKPLADGRAPSYDFTANQFALINPSFSQNHNKITNASFYYKNNPSVKIDNYNYNEAPSSFVYVYNQPDLNSPLVFDSAYNAADKPINTDAESVPARAYTGDIIYIKQVQGEWLKIQWTDGEGWIYNPKNNPVAVHIATKSASLKDNINISAIYGRAYPEESAYVDTGVTPQSILPLEYTLKPNTQYPVADLNITADYFSSAQQKEVVGQAKYYMIYLGHHLVFINANDVNIKDNPIPNVSPYDDFGINAFWLIILTSCLMLAVIIIIWYRFKIKKPTTTIS
ncbi:MAG: N-acetylmuramoyl-L-alanine amidase [Bifidobacteriaceae bacterium]|jgi:N-acetyl-anhydromuramyl-L-alanine amidase AmpD|nr:N-acetylmuramoyl-L-alanine amidase [Bifidobacteriaceae bacterium]